MLRQRLWAVADQGLVPTEIKFPAPPWSQVNTGETARLPQLPTNNQIPEATAAAAAHSDCVWLHCPQALCRHPHETLRFEVGVWKRRCKPVLWWWWWPMCQLFPEADGLSLRVFRSRSFLPLLVISWTAKAVDR